MVINYPVVLVYNTKEWGSTLNPKVQLKYYNLQMMNIKFNSNSHTMKSLFKSKGKPSTLPLTSPSFSDIYSKPCYANGTWKWFRSTCSMPGNVQSNMGGIDGKKGR